MRPSRSLETADSFHPMTPRRVTKEEYHICFAAKGFNPSCDISSLSANTDAIKKLSAYSVKD